MLRNRACDKKCQETKNKRKNQWLFFTVRNLFSDVAKNTVSLHWYSSYYFKLNWEQLLVFRANFLNSEHFFISFLYHSRKPPSSRSIFVKGTSSGRRTRHPKTPTHPRDTKNHMGGTMEDETWRFGSPSSTLPVRFWLGPHKRNIRRSEQAACSSQESVWRIAVGIEGYFLGFRVLREDYRAFGAKNSEFHQHWRTVVGRTSREFSSYRAPR